MHSAIYKTFNQFLNQRQPLQKTNLLPLKQKERILKRNEFPSMDYLIFVTQLNDAHKTIFKSRNRLDIRAHTKQLRRGPTTHLFKMPRARTAPIVGSWCWAAAKFISSCKELSSPRCCLGVCIRVPRIPITGNDAKRAAA